MGEKDILQKNYLAKPERFADLFNGALFDGAEILKAAELSEYDTVISKTESGMLIEKICDGGKKQKYALWILENQETVDYSMPVRIMLREALEYDKQIRNIKAIHKEHEKIKQKLGGNKLSLRAGEYLYHFYKDDRLLPVVTLVLFWGGKPWDGPKGLHEMLTFDCFAGRSSRLRKRVADYPIQVYDLGRETDFEKFHTELKEVFELYIRRNHKQEFYAHYETIDKRKMTIETARFIGEITNSQELIQRVEDEKRKGHKEEDTMCIAITEMYNDGVHQGIEQGMEQKMKIVIKNMLERNMNDEDIIALAECTQEDIAGVRGKMEQEGVRG